MMIRYFFVLLCISGAFGVTSTPEDIETECIDNEDCYRLLREIVSQVTTSVDPCIDIHSYMCTNNERQSDERKSLERRLSNMSAYLITLLDTPPSNEDNALLKVEKNLYKSCIQLGNTHQNEVYSEQLKSHIDNLGGIALWQDVEYVIFSLGLGYSFFDMKVIAHPKFDNKNVILLQPPSLEKIKSLSEKIKKIIAYKQNYRRSKYTDQAQAIHDLYNFIHENVEYDVLRFFEGLQEAKRGSLVRATDFPKHYTTVRRLKNMTIHSSFGSDFSVKVDWINIIHRLLQSRNIEFDTDNVILKSPRYFAHLTKLLRETPNNVIVAAIQTKALTDNLPYVDWERSNLLERISRVDFCFKETKLYGASHKLAHEWLTEDDDRRTQYRRGESIFTNIMSTIQKEISLYNSKSPSEANYYMRKLFSSIENLEKYVYDSPYNLYYTLNITESYFNNILEYRKLLANEDLQRLKQSSGSSEPFSFNNQDEAQNRYIISTLINTADMLSPNMPKEAHYGTFGVKTAALIIALLHEDTFNVDSIEENETTKRSLVHPKYPEDVDVCVREKWHFRYSAGRIVDIITQDLAVNTAYKALKNDPLTSFHDVSNSYLTYKNITQEKLFFLAYVKDNCHLESAIVNGILSDDNVFDKAFHCEMNVIDSDNTTCILGKV